MRISHIKILLGTLVFCLLLIAYSSNIYSQDPNSELYKQYASRLEQYQRSHNQYVLARSNYIRFQTLSSEEEAISSTKIMLSNRDEVVVAYIKLLINEVNEAEGLENDEIDRLVINLQDHEDWFQQHSNIVNSAETLEELVSESNTAKNKYDELQKVIYKTFAYISYGKVADYDERLVDIYSDLRAKYEVIRNEERDDYKFTDDKLISIDNWLVESQSSITRSQEILETVKTNIDELEKADRNRYNQIIIDLEDSRLHMKKATSFMEEVIRTIKTEDN